MKRQRAFRRQDLTLVETLEPRLLLSTWYVDDRTDPLEDGSAAHPFDAIQQAIDGSANGDEVVVLPGLYTGLGNRDITFRGKGITVRSQAGAAQTVIDAQGTALQPHRGFIFSSGETGASILQGLTIRGGYANEGGGIVIWSSKPKILGCAITENFAIVQGGGIRISQGCGVRIENSEITRNEANNFGGGVSATASRLVFEDNVVSGNTARNKSGGGMHLASCTAIIRRCVMRANQSPGDWKVTGNNGGGALMFYGGNVSVLDSLFLGNSANSDGGAMCAMLADGQIRGNVFVGNQAKYIGGAVCLHETRQDFIGNIVLDNAATGTAGGVRIHARGGMFSQNILAGNIARGGGGGGALITGIAPARVINSLFAGNYALNGGGLYVAGGTASSLLQSSTIAGNAANAGRAIYSYSGAPLQVRDSVLWGSASPIGGIQPDVQYSDVQGGYAGTGNINADPLFLGGPSGAWTAAGTYDAAAVQTVLTGGTWTPGELVGKFIDPDTADAMGRQFYVVANDAHTITVWGNASALAEAGYGFQIYDYHLQAGSPAIDAGMDAGVYKDLHGVPRPQDFPGVDNNGPLPEFDMGAYEAVPPGSAVAVDDRYSIEEDGTLSVGVTGGLLANDIGGPTAAVLAGDVEHGELTLNADGSFAYVPQPNFNGADSFTYQAGTNVATVTITVLPFNDPPVARVSELTTDEDVAVLIDLRTLVTDVETPPEQLVFTVGGAVNGAVQLFGDGHTARFVPDLNYNGLAYFDYSVGDTGDNGDCPITVRGVLINVMADAVADPPLLTVQDAEGDEDTAIPLSIAAEVTDSSEDLSLIIAGVPDGAALSAGSNQGGGTWVLAPEELAGLTFTPPRDANGQFVLSVTAVSTEPSNGDTASTTAMLSVKVNNLADLSGRVFDDLDNDGPDEGEPGIGGVSMRLTGTDDRGPVSRTVLTAGDGSFLFDDLRPGTYALTEPVQPEAFLDGDETAGALGGTAGNDTISGIVVETDAPDAAGYAFGEIRPSVITGLVWEDFNNDGEVDFGEKAIEGVSVRLTGTDDRGQAVDLTVQTDADGIYEFFGLRPGEYALREIQPAGFEDGVDVLGLVNGMPVGSSPANDEFSGIVLRPESVGENYNFGERPVAAGTVQGGQTATIGFWHNKNGQALIRSLNGGPDSVLLGNWLAATFPNMYGPAAGANYLAGKTNAQVAEFYRQLFLRNGKTAPGGGPPKLDAQVLAVALATYVTNESLVSARFNPSDPANPTTDPALTAEVRAYGFVVTEHGVGTALFNVGDNGSAFGVEDDTQLSVLDTLLATNQRTSQGLLYDLDGDGLTDGLESTLRALANEIYGAINEQGHI